MVADFAGDLPPAVAVALVSAWAELYGMVSFELFGQFRRVVEDRGRFFGMRLGGWRSGWVSPASEGAPRQVVRSLHVRWGWSRSSPRPFQGRCSGRTPWEVRVITPTG